MGVLVAGDVIKEGKGKELLGFDNSAGVYRISLTQGWYNTVAYGSFLFVCWVNKKWNQTKGKKEASESII